MSDQNSLLEDVRNRFMRTAAYLERELDALYREGVLTQVDWIKLKEDSKLSAQAVKDALNRTDYPLDMQRALVIRLIQEYELSAEKILNDVRNRRYSTQVIERKLRSIERQVFPDLDMATTRGQFSERQRNDILRAMNSKRSNTLRSIRALRVDSARFDELLESRLEDYRRELEELAARYRPAVPETVIPTRPTVIAHPVEETSRADVPLESPKPGRVKFEPQPSSLPIERAARKQTNRSVLIGLSFIVIACLVCVMPIVFFTRILPAFVFPIQVATTDHTETPKTIKPMPINTPTKTPTNTPMNTPTSTSTSLTPTMPTLIPTKTIISGFYKGSLIDAPDQMLIRVGKPTTLKIEGTSIGIALEDFEQTRLQGFGENSTRFFTTRFELGNPSPRSIVFSIQQLFAAANNSGRRLSQSGSAVLETRGTVTLRPGTQITLVLDWRTSAYIAPQSRPNTQRVFVVVNTPINDDLAVTLDENSAVFVLDFPQTP